MLHQVNFHNPFNGASVDVKKKFSPQIGLNIHANMFVNIQKLNTQTLKCFS